MERASCRGRRGLASLGISGIAALVTGVWLGGCGLDELGSAPPGQASSSSAGGSGGDGASVGPGGTGGVGGTGGAGGVAVGGMGGTGGMGAGGMGAGGTGGAGGGPVVIREWAATQPDLGASTPPTYSFPDGWLEIKCDTINRTSQFGPHSIRRPYGANAARPRNVGKGWGLSVESVRTNKLRNSDSWKGTGWDKNTTYGMGEVSGQSDPANEMQAVLFDSPPSLSGKQSSYTTTGGTGYSTAWLKGNGMFGPFSRLVVDPDPDKNWPTSAVIDVNDGMAWRRYELSNVSGYFRLETRGDSDGDPFPILADKSVFAYGAQHELNVKYPSSYIPTLEAERTREADILRTSFAASLLPGGSFHVILKIAPNYASTENVSDEHHLLYMSNRFGLWLDLKNSKVVLESDDNQLAGPTGVTWSRDQELVVEAKVTSAGRFLSLKNASGGNFEVSDVVATPWPTNLPIYILSRDTGAQECADLRSVAFYQPN
ncbi:phage head spike fiber domain-containing protein [Polyangium jinanense]|uniref:Uncharacterized protein n=1 Tax=Polyangium jinanense TaxID=2829994 RepID=A0A9X4AV14_9BACT|nr:hypothetical protein [Polyangium jinanense]MDC3959947.1 hypothetical protein [Polyangium jinanense]MDC3983827.1 hypothetical protein [Polyangium jinanense]